MQPERPPITHAEAIVAEDLRPHVNGFHKLPLTDKRFTPEQIREWWIQNAGAQSWAMLVRSKFAPRQFPQKEQEQMLFTGCVASDRHTWNRGMGSK